MKILLVIIGLAIIYYLFKLSQKKNIPLVEYKPMKMPANWPEWQEVLDSNKLPSLKIHLISGQKPTLPWQSKFGGNPYWPIGESYPVDENGSPLYFLAQINFSEISEKLRGYPKQGLLQFFIAVDEDLCLVVDEFIGDDNSLKTYLQNPKNFKVVYHKDIINDPEKLSINNRILDLEDSFLGGESLIAFELIDDIASPLDYRFKEITKALDSSDDAMDYAYDSVDRQPCHKIGGFASFTQTDPRTFVSKEPEWLLLFQMDSDDNEYINIMWGDSGIANFFIREKDLQNLDFTKVWYNWDCC